jgi:type IV pilus assembly protein PilO
MNALVENFLNRPFSHRVGIWGGVIAVVTFIFWQYFYSGLRTEYTDLTTKIDELQTEKVNEQRLARELPKVRAAVEELDIQLRKAILELPDKREIPDLLSSISNLAKDAGLEVTLFRPKPENMKDFYAEIPVAMNVQGTYHQVAAFFDEVGRLSRIVNLGEIMMKEPELVEGQLEIPVKVSCTATTFRFLEESERIQTVSEDDKKKRRRK